MANQRQCLIVERHDWETGSGQRQLQFVLKTATAFFGGGRIDRKVRVQMFLPANAPQPGLERTITISREYPNGTRRTNGFPEMGIIPSSFVFFQETGVWLGQPLPRRWVRELTARASTLYARNPRFRRSVRAAGDRGRDHLWMFMRHWLSGLMRERRPHLHARIPASYNNGQSLPGKPITQPRRIKEADQNAPPARCPAPERAWAAAAHFHLG